MVSYHHALKLRTFKHHELLFSHNANTEEMRSKGNENDDENEDEVERAKKLFWESQAKLAATIRGMSEEEELALKKEQRAKFADRRMALVSDSAFFSILIFSFLWMLFDNPFVSISYGFGTAMGTAYSYGLGKYVETLGGSVDDTEAVEGAGVGQARFAFLILLFGAY